MNIRLKQARLRATICIAGLTASLSTGISFAQQSNNDALTLQRLHDQPGLSGPSLRGASFSPDGNLITILRGRKDNAGKLDLWAFDVSSGEASLLVSSSDILKQDVALSEEEKNRRERQRIYTSGIISYNWDTTGEQVMFPLGGDVFVYNLETKTPTQLTTTDTFETDPKFSPQSGYVSFVRDDELFVYDLDRAREKQITKGANETIRNGVSSFVTQEELNRFTGYWWSPDETRIAFTQIDESPVPVAERVDINADDIVTIRQRYPFAGTNNVTIKLGITTPNGKRPTWVDLGDNPDIYLADAYWSVDGSTLYVARLSRDQKRLDLLAADPKTGKTRILFSETSPTWVNLGLGLSPLSDGGFLWSSERSGFQHLYRYDANGTLLGAVTGGSAVGAGGIVTNVNCIDEKNNRIYYSGWHNTVLERHVYVKSLTGEDLGRPITTQEGWNSASFSKNCDNFILTHTSDRQPRQASLRNKAGEHLFWLNENQLDENHPYTPYLTSHQNWEYGQIEAEDGQMMDYKILKPSGLKPGEKAPAIHMVYGGPHAQRVRKTFGNLLEQHLADQGYVVFWMDNRGAGNRGTKFENPLYRAMGRPETDDQALGAQWLGSLDFVDEDRIGVYGWSYGGYMALHMLLQKPELYAGGVVGAPVTDWRFYDTAYTERYMGHPETDADAYTASAPLTYTDNLEDPMLIIHGMADDNVIFQNTVKLVDDLQKKGKTFELMTYPGEKHGFRKKTSRLHRDRMIVDFFDRVLK